MNVFVKLREMKNLIPFPSVLGIYHIISDLLSYQLQYSSHKILTTQIFVIGSKKSYFFERFVMIKTIENENPI